MLKAIDFFCGAGGLTRGLLDAGVTVLAGVDSNALLRDTYELNNVPSRFVEADIRKVDVRGLRRDLRIQRADRVLYAACTPCQPFSTLNQMQGRDDRKNLLLAFAKLVEESPPDLLLVENVPGLHTAYGRDIYARFVKSIERAGFTNRFESLLDAKDYGVPQVRRRFIMLASRHGEVSAPRRTRIGPTVRTAIGELPPIAAGGKDPLVVGHEARSLAPHHLRLLRAIPHDGGSRADVEDSSLLLRCHRNKPRVHKDVFGRMKWDAPAPTLTCRCTDAYCGRFVHPDQDRAISVREAALLQSFPPEYEFYANSIHQKARQIGNAVPVELARRLGRAALRTLGQNNKRPVNAEARQGTVRD